jgi:hypothetical protein
MKILTKHLYSSKSNHIPDSEVGEIPTRYNQKPVSVFIELGEEFGSDPFAELYWAIQKRPKKLVIQLASGGKISHEATLACYHLLQTAKQKGLKVKTVAWGSLIEGALLLFLCGDERSIANPSAYFEISSLKRLKEVQWDENDRFTHRDYTQQPKFLELYKEVFRLLNAFIPAEEVSDKRVRLSGLGEYGLLDDDEAMVFHKTFMR